MSSLDPRVNRLQLPGEFGNDLQKQALDQLGTYEVFLVPKEGKPLESVGIVHASEPELAFLFGKEQFSRRFTCIAMAVCPTEAMTESQTTDNKANAYDSIPEASGENGDEEQYEVFHMNKRGKQHHHVGSVMASSPTGAFNQAKQEFYSENPLNVWVIPTSSFFFNEEEDADLWATLPEKKYRDAIFYKASEKINQYKESQKTN